MTQTNLKDRAKRILAESAAPCLLKSGFSKNGNRFVRATGKFAHVIEVQYSRWNNTDELTFTFNCGVWLRGVTSAYLKNPEKSEPRILDCCISARVGMLVANKHDVWWSLKPTDTVDHDHEVKLAIESVIQDSVIPFLSRFDTQEKAAEFLSGRVSGDDAFVDPRSESVRAVYAAAAWKAVGESDRCRDCLERAVLKAKGMPNEEDINSFAKKFSC